jgi:gluconate 5-dehydrogenase
MPELTRIMRYILCERTIVSYWKNMESSANFLSAAFGLAGRTALVTGSCSGLGLAIAQALGRAGARVIVNGRQARRCEAVAQELAAQGITALAAPFDVSEAPMVAEASRRLADEGRHVDVLVANAGVQNRKPVIEMTLPEWRALMSVHVDGAFICARAFLPGMLARGFGRVILMSSVAGCASMPGIAAYASAKGALAAFTRALAVEYGARGITANAIAPGFTRTEFTRKLQDNPAFDQFLASSVPIGRWAEPREIAPAAVYLASPAGSFVNGHVLTIDGGMLAHL